MTLSSSVLTCTMATEPGLFILLQLYFQFQCSLYKSETINIMSMSKTGPFWMVFKSMMGSNIVMNDKREKKNTMSGLCFVVAKQQVVGRAGPRSADGKMKKKKKEKRLIEHLIWTKHRWINI